MIDNIQIIDDFFTPEIFEKINNYMNTEQWICHCITRKDQDRLGDYAYWNITPFYDEFFSITLKNIIEQKLNRRLQTYRIVALSQTFGQDGTFHTDHECLNNIDFKNRQNFDTNNVTFCFYFNNEIVEESGGNIYFKIPNEKYLICAEPLKNRGIFFPAYLLHKPTAFNLTNKFQRFCITWKFYDLDISDTKLPNDVLLDSPLDNI